MIETYIQKGEAVLVYSDLTFDDRYKIVHKAFGLFPEVTIYAKEKVLIDDVRDFIYEMQKEGSREVCNVKKLGILICDDVAFSAQHSLLKILEDLGSDVCILIYSHKQSVFIPTVLSRVVVNHENSQGDNVVNQNPNKYTLSGETVAKRFDMIKVIMEAYGDEKLSKQDIIRIVEDFQKNDKKKALHTDVYVRTFSMLKQPSVSIKYVLEYVVGVV